MSEWATNELSRLPQSLVSETRHNLDFEWGLGFYCRGPSWSKMGRFSVCISRDPCRTARCVRVSVCVCVFGNIYHFAPHLHHLCQPLFTIIVDTKFSWTSCTILRPYLFIFSWYCQCDGLPGCVRLPAEARHFLMLKPSSPAVISGSILPGEKAAGVWSLLLALSRTHFNKWIHISSRPRAFKAGCQIKHVELNPDPLFLIRTKVRKEHRLGNSSNRALRGTSGALRRFPHPLPLDKCPRNAASFWISFRLLFCSFLMAVKCCRQRQGRRWRSGCTEALQRMRASQRAALGLRWLLTGETQSK